MSDQTDRERRMIREVERVIFDVLDSGTDEWSPSSADDPDEVTIHIMHALEATSLWTLAVREISREQRQVRAAAVRDTEVET